MADLNQLTRDEHILEEPRKLPEMLNVLSILTFIGSGLIILTDLWYFAAAKKIYDTQMQGIERADQLPSWARGLQGSDPAGVAQRTYDNRVPIVVMGIIAAVLCIVGAIQMRKLKKTGFYIYLVGEVLPPIVTLIFIGAAAYSSPFAIISTLIFLIVFIILYATQLKYLK